MSDRYLKFANRPLGRKLVKTLGLPKPQTLERYTSADPRIKGAVLVGGTEQSSLLENLVAVFKSMDATTIAHTGIPQWKQWAERAAVDSGVWGSEAGDNEKVKALVFDASGLTDSTQSASVYQFFHSSARSLYPCARVIILGRPPESCTNHRTATVQRSLEGLSRSLGKELRAGSTTQLVYVENGAESNMESTLRFLLSPRSAYVSGQVIRIGKSLGEVRAPADWGRPLAGNRILVTGASRGIGEAIAETISRAGADVIALDIPQAQKDLDAVAERLGAATMALDIGAEDAPEKLVQAAMEQGCWHGIIHNAGITRDKTIARMPEGLWQQVLNVNLSAQERINEALVAGGGIRDYGRIVCVSSISGIAGNPGQTNYAMSKAGVIGMVESTAPIYAERGITINAVAPGFIETQMTAAIPFGIREAGRRMNSLSQGGLPVDVAETIAWLASPASSGITGNVVRVCGQSLLGA